MAGGNSGRGNAYLGRACPPRHGQPAAEPKPRKPLQRRAPLGSGEAGITPVSKTGIAGSTPASLASRKRNRTTPRWTRDDARDAELAAAWKAHALTKAPEVVTPDGLIVPGDIVTREPLIHDWQAHHWLEAHSIWAYRRELGCATLAEIRVLLYENRNSAPINRRTHEMHNSWTRRITRDHVPLDVWAFAVELDVMAGRAWATVQLERDYPEVS